MKLTQILKDGMMDNFPQILIEGTVEIHPKSLSPWLSFELQWAAEGSCSINERYNITLI